MRSQHEEPIRPPVALVEQVGERGVVAQRLGHLLAADLDHAVMDPVPGERPAPTDRLGALVLVVREGEVDPTAVQIEPVAQKIERHHGALDVPPGPARTPRRVPRRLTGLGLLPQGEVERVPLVLVDFDPSAGPQRLERLPGQQPVIGDGFDREVDAVTGLVGDAAVDQRGDVVDHLRHIRGRVRLRVGREDAQVVHGIPPRLLVCLDDLILRLQLGNFRLRLVRDLPGAFLDLVEEAHAFLLVVSPPFSRT